MKNKHGYPLMYKKVYSKPRLAHFLKHGSYVAVALTAAAFLFCFVKLFVMEKLLAVKFLTVSAVPFVLVSIVRHFLDSKRPYQVFDFAEMGIDIPKHKIGRSFPSRHVFSSFLIGTLAFVYHPILAASVLALGAFIGLSRILLGVHFVSDVAAGAIIGIASGAVGILVL